MQKDQNIQFLRRKDYKFIREIWQWWTWRTILIKDDLLDTEFICKKYSPFYETTKDKYFNYFIEEIKILHLLYHKNIVRIFNYHLYPEEKTWYIIMEYISWKTIESYLFENPEKIDEVFRQVMDWFKYLEEHNIIHRDIRPENILIASSGTVKIIDFWFWKKIEIENWKNKSISINWRYDIPNEFNEWIYNSATEIYFIGKLFEEIITNNEIQKFEYKKILSKMKQVNPEKRYSSFFEIYRWIINESNKSDSILFTKKEKEIYRSFASALISSISKIWYNSKYITEIEKIIENLDTAHTTSMLEEKVQNANMVIKVFIEWTYSYWPKKWMETNTLNEFLNFLKNSTEQKQKIIINNIWGRLDTVEREAKKDEISIDDIPF